MTWTYTTKTGSELEQLAQDLVAGKIVTSNDVPQDLVTSVFMSMMFLDPETWKAMDDAGIAVVYEYIDKAGPRSINGYPIFMSASFLDKDDATILYHKAREIHAVLEARKEAKP